MNKKKVEKVLSFLGKLKKDCLGLKRRKDLLDYGRGQLDLANIILKELD